SMDTKFDALCGITQEELESYFELEINEHSKKFDGRENYLAKLKNFYNGYKFAENAKAVYNPVSILNHFGDGEFRVYWADTGTPSFLANFIDRNGSDIADIENMELTVAAFGKYNEDEMLLIPLMYQAGYLTIKDYNELSMRYKLNYPNVEVRSSFAEFLSKQSGLDLIKRESYLSKLFNALHSCDVDAFMEIIKIYMQSVKFDLITKMTEYYFEFAFANILNMLGFNCEIEVHSAVGSVDAVVKLQKNVFVIEAKLDKPVEDALKQIEEKKYYVPYLEKGLNIFKIGVVFGTEERNVREWKGVKCD
ncbi:MAG: ATP-binding protein, partial [Fibromonadales bacterium]|nr:ATP-binding protein [Fibromonadales bacterium]